MTRFYLGLWKYILVNVWAICLQALAFTSAHSVQVKFCHVFVYQAISDSPHLCFCAFVCVVVNVLSVRSTATLLAGAVCTNIGCGGGLRGSQGEVGRHGPTLVHAHTHTWLLKQEAPNHTPPPPGDARTHTGTHEEGAASAALIKTVAVYLSLLLTVL